MVIMMVMAMIMLKEKSTEKAKESIMVKMKITTIITLVPAPNQANLKLSTLTTFMLTI